MNLSNLPVSSMTDRTVQQFDSYYSGPVEIDPSVYAAIKAFFTSRGFGEVAAENISIIIITQAKQDGYKPMQILDTLRGLNSVDLSGVVAEILNYNRFKSSSLGYAQPFNTSPEVARNIIV